MAEPDKLKICAKILAALREAEDGWPFLYPVDSKALPDYYRIIPTPMDLTTIQRNLKQGKYKTISAFSEDVNQIFLNCKHYNTAKAPVYKAGQRLQKLFNQKKREFNL